VGGTCLAPVYEPPHCIGIEDGQVREGFEITCGRGRDGPSAIIFHVAFLLYFSGLPTIVGVTLGIMHRHVSHQERRMRRYGAGALNHNVPNENNDTSPDATDVGEGNSIHSTMRSIVSSVKSAFGRSPSRSNSNQNNSTSRVVMDRARAYTAAFLLTWSWYIAIVVLRGAGVPLPLALRYLAILVPLQGFWNLMIFMYPKVTKAKRSGGRNNVSWCQAITEAFCPAINGWREGRIARNDEREIHQKEVETSEISTRQQQQGDAEVVTSILTQVVCPGSEEEKTEIEA